MRYYCSNCKETISAAVYDYSRDFYGRVLCRAHQAGFQPKAAPVPKKATPEARDLYRALKERGVRCELEKRVPFKTQSGTKYMRVDIAVVDAR